MATPSRYFTFAPGKAPAGRRKDQLTLGKGMSLAFSPGHGYYEKPAAVRPMTPVSPGRPSLQQQASSLAQALVRPQVDYLTDAANQRAQTGTQAIRGYTSSLASAFGAHDYTAPYNSAIQDQAAVDQALREAVTGAGSSAADELKRRLAEGGIDPAAAEAAAAKVAQTGQGSGAATVGLGSANLGELVADRAANETYGAKLPGIAGLAGLQDVRSLQGQVSSDLNDQLGQIAAQEPQLAYSILQDMQQRQDAKATAAAEAARDNAKVNEGLSAAAGYLVNDYGEAIPGKNGKPVPYTPYEKPSSQSLHIVKGADGYYGVGNDGSVTPLGIAPPVSGSGGGLGATHLQSKNINGHTFTFDPVSGVYTIPGTNTPVNPNAYSKPGTGPGGVKVPASVMKAARQMAGGFYRGPDGNQIDLSGIKSLLGQYNKANQTNYTVAKVLQTPAALKVLGIEHVTDPQDIYVTLAQMGVPAKQAFGLVAARDKNWGTPARRSSYFPGKAAAAAETAAPLYVISGSHPGMVAQGNIDLAHRPVVRNKDGSISTVRSITVGLDNGRYVLIPTVVGNKVVSNKAAIQYYRKTGQNLGLFTSEKSADNYAESLHDQQAQMYSSASAPRSLQAALSPEGAGGVYRPPWNKTLSSAQRAMVAQQALTLGLGEPWATPENVRALVGRMNQESGGQTAVVNKWDSNWLQGTPSIGLLQTIPSTFEQYALPGHTDIWDPLDNAIAAVRYMQARYGHIVGANGKGY